ncbi:MAG: phage terminase large subunit, partial [Gemmatimonadota bacterium]
MANYYDSATLDGAMISGVLAPFVERRVYVDLAASLRQSGDYTVLLIVGLTARTAGRRRAAVLDVVRKRLEGPDQVSMIKEAAAAYVPSVVKVEAVGYALTMVQSLKRELKTKVEPLRPDKDKRSRAIPAAAALARGDILLPKSARWMPEFLAELVAFPHGRHDDQVDALAYAAADIVMSRTRAVSL